MLRPRVSNTTANKAKDIQDLQPAHVEKEATEYAKKLKLAQRLHVQGIDPERWTEAEPASWPIQKRFRETGEKPVEHLVNVAKVSLAHPLGRPHATQSERPDAHALNLHYAKYGVDPGKAHEGDPLPPSTQRRLQQVTKAADGSDIPLGIPGIYRGYDDGYFYAANDGTQESPETQRLRRDLATAKAQRLGDAAPIAANDNDPEIDEAVARSYQAGGTAQVSVSRLNQLLISDYSTYLSTVTKLRKGLPLTEKEMVLCNAVTETFPKVVNEAKPVNAVVVPGMAAWILNLFRGNPDGGSCPKPDCNEVYKYCNNLCTDIYATKPDQLPGEGSDMPGRRRRCVRECMEVHGCFDF